MRTSKNPKRIPNNLFKLFQDWDKIVPMNECRHCDGTGRAPSSDGRTACGFCK